MELGWVEILCKISPAKTQKSKASQHRWMHVDPGNSLVDQPGAVETLFETVKNDGYESRKRKRIIAFALAAEHVEANNQHGEENESNQGRLTDVTPRYANSWSQSLQLRSAKRHRSDSVSDNKWWTETLKMINSFHHSRTKQCLQSSSPAALHARGTSHVEAIEIRDSSDENSVDRTGSLHLHAAIDLDEKAELLGSAANEAIPTNKAAFNNHPIYAIPAVLNVNEVFASDAKSRICGIFKGAPVYRRNDVHTALVAKKWLFEGRKVKQDEMGKPVKRVKARTKASPKGFQPLRSYGVGEGNDGSEEARQKEMQNATKPDETDDGMDNLYAHWQTVAWSPLPVGPNDPIPVNEYNNIELELLNPGLEHLEQPRMSKVAKQLGMYVVSSIVLPSSTWHFASLTHLFPSFLQSIRAVSTWL
jgi:xeroderma pigmentosum group C-complementing protein